MARRPDSQSVDEPQHEVDGPERWPDPGAPDEVDPELMALAETPGAGTILRPILLIAVLVLGGSIISDWREELAYFFSDTTPVALGTVTEFPLRASADPSWTPELPHNRLVELRGITTRRSISTRHKYAKLIGGEVYVEIPRDDQDESPLEREAKGPQKADRDRTMFEGVGRAIAFTSSPNHYQGLRQFYTRNYNTTFCVDVDEATLAQLEQKRREGILQTWRTLYEEASPEDRVSRKMAPSPTAEQLDMLQREEPLCVDAYLIQVGVQPRDHWWYVALSALFILLMIFDVVMIVRWALSLRRR